MLLNLQALRALAACLVVVVHLAAVMTVAGWSTTPALIGHCGVDLFFVLSGFLMVHTVALKPAAAGAFLLNRVIRVVPLYWLCTLAVFAIGVLRPELLGKTEVSAANLIRSLLFIPYARPNGLAEPLLFLGWTLNYEMFFYVLFAGSLLQPRAQGWGAAVAIVGLVCAGAVLTPATTLGRFYTNPIMLEFVFGMALARLLGRSRALPRDAAWLLLVAGAVILVGRFLVLPVAERAWWSGLPATLMLAGAVSLERRGSVWRAPAVQLLGAASYSLYLVHPFVAQALGKLMVAQFVDRPFMLDIGIFVIVAAVIGAAVTLHWFVERPLTAGLRRLASHPPSAVERQERSAFARSIGTDSGSSSAGVGEKIPDYARVAAEERT